MVRKHWRSQLNNLPDPDRNEILFMLAPRWADDIRTLDRAQHRGPWHYINWPFKPDSEPESVGTKLPQRINILTALAENERIVRTVVEPEKKAIALTWLFHLVGDLHQPLHTIQIFTKEYPLGDRGGKICVRVSVDGRPNGSSQVLGSCDYIEHKSTAESRCCACSVLERASCWV